LLTGVLPFRSVLESIGGKPKLLLEHNTDIPEPLQRICLKAMEQDSDERYQTAEQLKNDLDRFLAGKPIFARPTLYKSELQGHIVNHLADLSVWEREGFLSRRERDELVLPYDRLRGQDSPWLSETRHFLTGPLLMRVGAWLLLLSAVLWPLFYWLKIGQPARVASSGLPTGIMAALGAWFLIRGNRKYAVSCLGSFALLLLVFLLVLLSEFGWLKYPQPPQWELWGSWVENGPPKAKPAGQLADEPDDDVPQEIMRAKRRSLPTPSPGWDETLQSYAGFILSNSQMLVATAAVTLCIGLLMILLRASFYAPWLATAFLGVATLTLLMIGDKERLLGHEVAWVGVHYLVVSALFLATGYAIERATSPRVARTFYLAGTMLFVLSWVTIAVFGTQEWFHEILSYDNETLNFWLLAYSAPLFFCGLGAERFGTEGQRNLAWIYYYLVPIFLLVPLNLLVGSGWEIWDIGRQPLGIYEVMYFLASVALLAVGRILHVRAFVFAGLWGLAFFVLRVTYRHLLDYLAWPVVVAAAGVIVILMGIALPLWLRRKHEPRRTRAKSSEISRSTMPAIPEPETIPLPGS
jgi:hypothetical protein